MKLEDIFALRIDEVVWDYEKEYRAAFKEKKWTFSIKVADNIIVSITLGPSSYSIPRQFIADLNEYTKLEIGFFNPKKSSSFNCSKYIDAEDLNYFENIEESYICPYISIDDAYDLINKVVARSRK